jgi:hypothetical protein
MNKIRVYASLRVVHIFYFQADHIHITCEARLTCTASFLSHWSTFAQTLNRIDHNSPWANIYYFLLSFILVLLLLLLLHHHLLLLLLLLLLYSFTNHGFFYSCTPLVLILNISLQLLNTSIFRCSSAEFSQLVAGHLQVQYRFACGTVDACKGFDPTY